MYKGVYKATELNGTGLARSVAASFEFFDERLFFKLLQPINALYPVYFSSVQFSMFAVNRV